MARVIFHVDLNAFFASAEEIKNPNLKGLPVAVGSLSRRSVLSTANYEARKYGVHSAMPVHEALEKCPDLIVVQGDYNYYRSLSSQFFAYLRKFSNMLEPASIDECYMDVTETIKKYKRPLDLAYQIQNGIHENLGLNVSIGVAPTRFLAKMASDMRKPAGITVLRKSEIKRKLWPLPIEEIHGLGKKSAPLLRNMGIQTIEDFANPDNEQAILNRLGPSVYSLILKCRGQSSANLHYSTSQKSISVSRTYLNDLYTSEEVLQRARDIVQELSYKMKRDNQKGKLVSLTLRDTEFHTIVRSLSLDSYQNDFYPIFEKVQGLVDQYFEPVGYRHIGVTIGSLKDSNKIIEQTDLFVEPVADTNSILDQLNEKIEGIHLMKASDLLKEKKHEQD
ncbi:MAG: DNA polymerase IV [Firmicutes bacterium]|nr:DNA polymerase IV [Bacillota bacterium]